MKTREIITLLLLLLTSTVLSGQNSSDTILYKTILFKVAHSNSAKTSYLFGTHHAFGKYFFDSLTEANKALMHCDMLIKENLNIPGEMAEDIINRRTTLTKWSSYLKKEDLSFIENLFAKSPTHYTKMTPTEMYVFLNRYFKQQVCLNKNPDDTSLSLDDYIGFKAGRNNITLYGLETTEEQINLINKDVEGMPRSAHKKRLAGIIHKIRSNNASHCEETDWYSHMEIDLQLHEPCRNSLLLTDRNNKWMGSIKEKLESNNCFIAVGLSHLMFECGLINQMRQRGYTVTPITVN